MSDTYPLTHIGVGSAYAMSDTKSDGRYIMQK